MQEALRTMTIDPELSRQLITFLSDRDNPASISKAIDLILSVCPDRDAEDLTISYTVYLDETGRVVPHEDTGPADYNYQGGLAGCVTGRCVKNLSSQPVLQRLIVDNKKKTS